IRVILLTSSNPAPDLSPQNVAITGTPFRDTLAPIGAVLKVREGLGNQAVARVCYHFYPNEDCKQKASDPEARLQIVEIQDQTYGLPLGWKLSHSTFEVVRWMLGRPELCDRKRPLQAVTPEEKAATGQDTPQLDEKTVRSNSCVLQSIVDLLAPKQANS